MLRTSTLVVLVPLALSAACAGSSDSAGGAGTPNDASAASDAQDGSLPNEGGAGDASPRDASSGDGGGGDGSGTDALVTSFVFVGCNRLQKADWSSQRNPSSANLPQLQRTFADVVALPDNPKFFFFTGDLVLSLVQGTTNLASQLAGWADVWKADPIASRVPLVPLVGNHEMLYKSNGVELSNGPADAVWTQWLATNGFDAHAGNGPTTAAPNADALQDDQSKLSYSFDDGGTHFVVLNTDTWTTTADSTTGSTQIGWIALRWLTADLRAAQANANVSRIFVFGHKPILAPDGSTASADAINPALASSFASLLDSTPKVKGYLCAHAHEWFATKLPGSRGVYQVIAGNGGSQLETAWSPAYYGFTEARVYQSGRVGVVSPQRPVPTPYNASPAMPATPVAELTIAQ